VTAKINYGAHNIQTLIWVTLLFPDMQLKKAEILSCGMIATSTCVIL